ncbi:MAG: hypothetical protein GY793_04780 [Proteobacteria bacterium]|nr:hypothetical protein [Pseudomonadota bacterium]
MIKHFILGLLLVVTLFGTSGCAVVSVGALAVKGAVTIVSTAVDATVSVVKGVYNVVTD